MRLHEPSPTSSHGSRHQSFSRNNSPTPVGPDPSAAMPSQSRPQYGSPGPTSQFTRQQPSPSLSASSASHHVRFQSMSRSSSTSTFAQKFIRSDELRGGEDKVTSIEGENDFSGKRYVWVKDPVKTFKQGWIVEDLPNNQILVQFEEGSQAEYDADDVDKVNPTKFDKANDMSELTHLNEASVIHNLQTRYQSDLIYTYSGLFLVAINPYCGLDIYNNKYINMYKGQSKEDTSPHIFAVADAAFRRLVGDGENQSILVTGESGAGKTENTKKVIQYLAAVATTDPGAPMAARSQAKQSSNLSQQILRANPILESFGNAQTVRNHNSSRFGKFIRIQFSRSGQIAGAFIDWYLLEKSRVVKVGPNERSYHIFYQLLNGTDSQMRDQLLLSSQDIADYSYLRGGNDTIVGVSDPNEWDSLIEAFKIMGITAQEQMSIFKTVAAILHLGNVSAKQESRAGDQAALTPEAKSALEKACRLLGVQVEPFIQGLLHPKVKAGREWVEKVQNAEQVRLALDALAKGIYERGFGDLVNRINKRLDRGLLTSDDNHFIGVLDIAGFEIFDNNSFEQLCINYTNEKLQQFFNHYMFVLEQDEYEREQIEWQFIDFGKDLQPTIDLIELSRPIGIFSCLDEDSVMPKATDQSFTDKLHGLWEDKSPKYLPARPRQGFILTHYAAKVEYSTEGWLEKNKDPLNDNLTRLLATSKDDHVANLFSDCAGEGDEINSPRSRVKRGPFRTVAQRHKEQLGCLMSQLHSTQPHFVRCILPNHKKKPKQFEAKLVLDQLRCNGVLEGIRIARTGFPNRQTFAEFRSRYEVLCQDMPKGYLDGQQAARIILDRLKMDKSDFRIGITKVFFRAGVLADLEEQRDSLIREIITRFQAVARGTLLKRRAFKSLYREAAAHVIQKNMNVYLDLQSNAWWKLFVQMRPMLSATSTASEVKRRDEKIEQLQAKIKQDGEERQLVEEERRKAQLEAAKAQQILEAERRLMVDKEDQADRLRLRESELSDQLKEALADQDELEDELEKALDAQKKAEEEVEVRCKTIEQAGEVIHRYENEKRELARTVQRLEESLTGAERDKGNLQAIIDEQDKNLACAAQCDDLEQQIRCLQSELGVKDRKLQEAETCLKDLIQEKDAKCAAHKAELQDLRNQLAPKTREVDELTARLIQQQDSNAADRAESINRYQAYEDRLRNLEAQLRQRDTQIADLQAQNFNAQQMAEDARARQQVAEAALADAIRNVEDAQAGQAAANRALNEMQARYANLDADNNKLQFDNDNLRKCCSSNANKFGEKEAELKKLQDQLKQKDAENAKLKCENDKLGKCNADAVQRNCELEKDFCAVADQWRQMQKEACEARKKLEGILPFFQTHFSDCTPGAGKGDIPWCGTVAAPPPPSPPKCPRPPPAAPPATPVKTKGCGGDKDKGKVEKCC